jgi:CBS-domain-containing membrane protein
MSAGSIGLAATRRNRIHTMLWSCVGIALSALVGSLVGHNSYLTVLVTGVWGVGAGLLVSLGQSALVVGLQSTVAVIILAHFALPPTVAV